MTTGSGIGTAGGTPELDVARIEAIAAMDDRVLRNLWITQTYHELADAISAAVSPVDANWCTFAVWASKSVGAAIRGEAVPEWLAAVSEASSGWTIPDAAPPPLPHWLQRWRHAVGAVEHSQLIADFDVLCEQVSEQLGAGNLLVFAELAPLFARFVADPDTPVTIERSEPDEQLDRLEQAFALYAAARRQAAAGDDRGAAQRVLAANVLVGLHEQTRLQSAIAAGLDAAADDAGSWCTHHELHGRLARVAGHVFRRFWEHEATVMGVAMTTPEGPMHPGHPLTDPPPPGTPFAPAVLDPFELAELTSLWATYDGSRGDRARMFADDWVHLGDRMTFIANLFRSRQRCAPWRTTPPFTSAQVAELRAGGRPAGPL